MSTLIGLYSPCMGSGKTELTNVLVDLHGYTPVKFAGTLKSMIRTLLVDAGSSPLEAFEYTEGSRKEEIIPFFGVTTRYLMQTLGTEWGRNQVKGTVWIDVAKAKIQKLLDYGHNVVVDDMRFPNEFQAIKDLGGLTVRVIRPGLADTTGHTSEGQLEHLEFDYNLVNANGLDEWRGLASHFHEVLHRPQQVS